MADYCRRLPHWHPEGATGRGFYDLIAWVLMPNHAHLVLHPNVEVPSWVRDRDELAKAVGYVERNPVSASFVDRIECGRWSSAWAGESACPTQSEYRQ